MVFIQWLVAAVALVLTAFIVPGATISFGSALIAAVVLGLVNIFIKPLLLFFALPINILTLGLFSLIVNGLVIWIVSAVTPGFKVSSFGMAILFALVLAIVNVVFVLLV